MENIKYITNYQDDDFIIDIIYDPEMGYEQFVVYDKETGEIFYKDDWEFPPDGTTFEPIHSDLIKEGRIPLPSHAEEYEDDLVLSASISNFIQKYVDLDHPFLYSLVANYIKSTWVYDKLSVVPYLRAMGDYGSGKTRFASVVGSVCYKPLFLAGATSDAFIFRTIEQFKGTLILNELERVNTDLQSQLTIILNNGYEKGLYIGRVEGDRKKELKSFDAFSPKIITTRRPFKDLALESRIINILMKPTKRKDIPSMLDGEFNEEALYLRNQLLKYRLVNLDTPINLKPGSQLETLEPRLRQTMLPILSVINDEETEEQFFEYAKDFQGHIFSERSFEVDAIVAEKIVDLYKEIKGNEKVTIKEITDSVNKDFDEKEKISNKIIGQRVRDFGFNTKKVGGIYQVVYDKRIIDYLVDRYALRESLPSLQSPQSSSNSNVDISDLVDVKKGGEKNE